MADSFTNIHSHSDGSTKDSPLTIPKMIARLQELKQTACALTDHGSMLNTIDFYNACKKASIKPLLGMEAYVAYEGINNKQATMLAKTNKAQAKEQGILGTSHLILIAKNFQGYQNLCRLSGISQIEGFYYKPRIDYDILEKYHEGLICSTACMFGDFYKLVMDENPTQNQKGIELAGRLHEIFKDDFYVELQNHGYGGQAQFIPKAMKIAKDLGLNLVVSQDSHYAAKEDASAKDALYCIDKAIKLKDLQDSGKSDNGQMYMKSREEMEFAFRGLSVPAIAFNNTLAIAEKIDQYDIAPKNYLFPRVTGSAAGSRKKLEELCNIGWKKLVAPKIKDNKELKAVYLDRVKYEMDTICEMGFADYFLITEDWIRDAREHGVLIGPGRGCLTGDAKVYTGTSLKCLRDIKVGDHVITHTGYLKPVTATHCYETGLNEKLLEIETRYAWDSIKLTKDHKLMGIKCEVRDNFEKLAKSTQNSIRKYKYVDWSKLEWRQAKEYSVGDLLFTPWPKALQQRSWQPIDMLPYCRSEIVCKDKEFITIKSSHTRTIFKIKRYWEFNSLSCEIIGRWIGDGWISSSREKWGIAYNSDDVSGIKQLTDFLTQRGLPFSVIKHKQKKLVQVMVYSKMLVSLFQSLFPSYNYTSNTKGLGELCRLNSKNLRSLLTGLFAADGSSCEEYRTSFDTVSYKMAAEVKLCLLLLKVPCSVSTRKSWKTKEGYQCKESYKLRFPGFYDGHYPSELNVSAKGYLAKIERIKKCPGEKVYDITVKDNHSYLTSNFIVHNSAAGCLVSYLLGITQIADPIEYDLLFERFLVPGRPSMPDIDVDVSNRDGIIKYLEEKYGKDFVAPIVNRTEATCKSALVKAASISGDYKLGLELSKIVKSVRGKVPSFQEAYKAIPELQARKQTSPDIFAIAEKLEGVHMGVSGHASGVIVSSIPLSDIIPLHRSEDIIYTGYDMDQLKELKLVKLDILNVDVLLSIDNAVRLIKKNHDVDIDPYNIPLDDKKTWKLFCEGDTTGIFQFESAMMKGMLKEIKPVNLKELAAVNAIARPGALDAEGLIPSYIKRKHGLEKPVYNHPVLEPILESTFGLMIYQEQAMRIAKLMAGFNPIEVDSLRKSMSDKDESIIEKQREKFIKGCVDSGYHKDLALSIFENIKLFSGYAFNSSHALAYSYVAYITAYLKANYLLEFDIACLNKEIGKDGGALEDTTKFVLDLEAHNYKVKPPDVTLSNWDFSASNKREIHYALGAIKGISSEQMKEWTALRPFASLDDAIMKAVRSGVSSASIVLLATLGAFETLAPNTPHVMKSIVARVNKAKKLITNLKNRNKSDKKKLEKDPCFFTADSIQLSANALKLDMGDTSELSKKDTDISVRVNRIKTEMECLGFSVSGTLLDEYSFHVHRRATMTTSFYLTDVAPNETASVAGVITKLRKTTDKNGKRMGFLTISDGRSEVKVVVFGSVFESFADATWKEGKAIIVDGRKDDRDGMTLISSDIVFLHKDATNEEKANQEGSKAKDNTNTSKK